MPYHLVAFVVAALVVLVTTPIVKKIGLKSGYVDLPNPRKVHSRPMVRLGGISIFLGSLTALMLVWFAGGFGYLPPPSEYEIWGVTFGGLLFFVIGLLDDLFTLSAKSRLVMQLGVATMAWTMGVRIEFFTVPFIEPSLINLGLWSLPVTLVWLVGMTNAINFTDGLDGLAAGISGIAAVVMLITSLFMNQPAAAILAAALAGGALGFLRYNFNPAQIFMGDGGAYFLGFTLAGIGVIGLVKTVTTVAVVLPFLILAVPILDTSTVVANRLLRGQSPFAADKRHLHHRLLDAGLSQRRIVLFIYALTFWVGSIAMAYAGVPWGKVYAVIATLLLVYACWQALKRVVRSKKQLKIELSKTDQPLSDPVSDQDSL
ncbi:putative undecaprenyl-phosphate N-acetylglucosaminyl 1-phosphate transferase [Acaryochloris thomasi RCC1774]|uniref:Putative undecaprenyl-phosphate N-acetylglucosaminyl 1-phosphate transferase n=1 Tax=Acaryochloris thomasi RCC1774 TaxID=1764569 RepID=A0A2W1JUM8_9CYAN|nr:MraY family glycosyltransferase [Acaryochloris thomasi]PZD74192.1 putative undecaprenyl-phosphate N-acetylglucosaminyl 1-phosphate transferase [Acaryochloris thomasi RCC1774]